MTGVDQRLIEQDRPLGEPQRPIDEPKTILAHAGEKVRRALIRANPIEQKIFVNLELFGTIGSKHLNVRNKVSRPGGGSSAQAKLVPKRATRTFSESRLSSKMYVVSENPGRSRFLVVSRAGHAVGDVLSEQRQPVLELSRV